MRVSAAGNMPLQGLVKPPAKPVVMIDACGKKSEKCSKKIDAGRENAKNI